MVADSVDYDLLKTRRNREGLYFGVWKMSTKVSRALGLVLAGVLLDVIGFETGAVSVDPDVARGLAWLFGPVVGLLFVAAGVVLWRMPLTDAVHERVQRLLRRRQRRDAARRGDEAVLEVPTRAMPPSPRHDVPPVAGPAVAAT